MIRASDAARELGASPRHLRRWYGAHLRVRRVGRQTWVSREDVARLVERRSTYGARSTTDDRAVAICCALARGSSLGALVVDLHAPPEEVERVAAWYAAATGAAILPASERVALALAAGLPETSTVADVVEQLGRLRAELLRALARAAPSQDS